MLLRIDQQLFKFLYYNDIAKHVSSSEIFKSSISCFSMAPTGSEGMECLSYFQDKSPWTRTGIRNPAATESFAM